MNSTDFLNMNVPEYSDAADIAKVSENFETLDNNIKITADELADLKARIIKLEKTQPDIKINSFSANPKIAEKGDVVSVSLAWDLSTEAVKQTVNGITVTGNSYTDTGVASDKAYNLYVEDERGKKASAVASVVFANRVYAGVSGSASLSAAEVKQLAERLVTPSKNRTIVLTAKDQYVYYAYPKSMGTSIFRIGMFTGGFNQPYEINIENTKGYTETYYVYRSDNTLDDTFELIVE